MFRLLLPIATVLMLSSVCFAQSAPETKKDGTAKSKTQTEKTEKSDEPKTARTPDDMDSFFKKGEEQLKSDGSNCQPPPEPVA